MGMRCIQLRKQPGRRLPERRLAAALTSLCVMVKNRVRVRVSSRVRVRVKVRV